MKKSLFQTIKSAFNLSYLILIVLFCFAMATSFMSISYMAKYSSVSSGSDGARAAEFVIDAASGSNIVNLNLSNGTGTANYDFTVSNFKNGRISQVEQGYYVVMTLKSKLPQGITARLGSIEPEISDDGLIYTFRNAGTLKAGETESKTQGITFTASGVTDNAKMENIDVKVYFEQID